MGKQRHWFIMAVWVVVLMAVVALFWDRLFPKAEEAATGAAAITSPSVVPVCAPTTPAGSASPAGAASIALQQAIKAANPRYDGHGQIAEKDGKITIVVLANAGVTDLSPLRGLSLEALDVSGDEVSDLSPLRGMPLRRLGLENTKVTDLGPLKGLGLVELYLNGTPVGDLSPLKGSPLQVLNLYQTKVADLAPLAGMPLKSLWLNGTPVKDISPLQGCPLESLTLDGTAVTDLSPLAGSKIQRLHIAGSAVTDLTPLQGLPLTRLIFTPERISKGMDVVRGMSSLQEIGTTLERRMPPAVFWQMYDQGQLQQVP